MNGVQRGGRRVWPVVLIGLAVGAGPVRGDPSPPLKDPSGPGPPEWLTKAERTDFRETPRYDETVEYCRRLASTTPWVNYQTFGISPEGRALPLIVASKDGAFTPEAARAAGQLVVLVQNCIHAGECDGKDASLMLLRDIAITRQRKNLLDHVVLLVMPIFNVDGHERFSPYSRINQNGPDAMGWRVTSRNLNLNRDYMKADTVEMRAWLALWNAWRPDLFIDTHTTDGGDWQYDVLMFSDTHEAAAPPIARWLRDVLNPSLFRELEGDGHLPMIYFDLVDPQDPSQGIRSGGFEPRFSNGYVAIRNRPAIVVETHMLKPYRTRVIGHYNIMVHTLELLNRDPESLRTALRTAEEETAKTGAEYDPARRWPVAIDHTDEPVPLKFKGYAYRHEPSEVSGEDRIIYDSTQPVEIELPWYNGTKVTKTVNPPLAYIIPPQWTEVIELVKAHGLRCERLLEPVTIEVQSYRFREVSFASRPYEGRFAARFTTEPIVERRAYRPGSVIVRLDQPDAKVAIHLLEPEAPDSLISWGFFNIIFEQKEYGERHVLEDLARRMMAENATLREEFEAKLRDDAEFAANAWARLDLFYRRSPYWDDRMNVYPIGRVVEALKVHTEPVQ